MYFKRLEIFGFKSFADKTILNFEQGITAIVGPNGCGKSNIFDSIRWVLGEQSVKELRGASMEDVIFNGTENKPALGFAEVSMTFSNEPKMLPIEFSEVTVSRRLYRSGESEYLLNKTPVRLKDIQELFMGTGIGAEAYSLIQQGKIDLVVSARPEDRRILLDEASGITKYKSKKKEALNKLTATENNLLRINDIIVEVKRQIASIERHANKAKRYKDEFEKLKRFEIYLANYQINEFANNREEISKTLEEFESREQKFSDELQEINDFLENQSRLLDELEQKINDSNAENIKLDGQVDVNNSEINFGKERIENIASNINRLKEKKAQLIEHCRDEQMKIEDLKNTLMEISDTLTQKAEQLEHKKDNLQIIEKAVLNARREIKENEEKVLDITSKQVNVKNDLTEVMKEIQGCLARKRRLEMEDTKISSEKQEVDNRLMVTSTRIGNVSGKVEELKSDHQSKQQVFAELKRQISAIHKKINELETKRILLKSQKDFIEKLQVQYQDMPDPVVEGRLIIKNPPSKQHTGIIGKVKGVQCLESEKVKLFKNGFADGTDSGPLYEITVEAKFIELDPQQIINKIEEINQEIDQSTAEKEDLILRIEKQEIEISVVAEEIQNQEKSLSILKAQKDDISEECKKLLSELELVGSEIEEVKETLSETKKSEEEKAFYLDTLNQDNGCCQNLIKERQNYITLKLQEKEETTVFIAQLETELESDRDKQISLEENMKIFERSLDRELEEMKENDDEVEDLDGRRNQHTNEIEQLKSTIEELSNKKQSLKEILSDYESQKEEISQRMESFQSKLKGLEEELNRVKEKIHNQKLKDQEIHFNEKGINDRLLQTYKIDLGQIEFDESYEEISKFNVGSQEFDHEMLRLKKRCDSFGSVNLVAIEEFDELKERFEFLTKQQSDLLSSKESLHQTIIKINRKTRQMFMETFTKVSEEFRIYFRMLFGGGDANLILLDPDNVLESGIEIVARPPGKKFQIISLLSGGEKALTAIALIFGVFKVRPSPFCVLDEIDAALDDSNVERFGYLLKDFAKIAQFIVITHNKKTIANSNVMYGITMQEKGISKIVSVKLSEEKEEQKEEVPVGAL